MIRVAIVGGTGYTGVELLRILATHGEAEVVAVTSRGEAGRRVDDMYPSLRGSVDLEYLRLTLVSVSLPASLLGSQPRQVLLAYVSSGS